MQKQDFSVVSDDLEDLAYQIRRTKTEKAFKKKLNEILDLVGWSYSILKFSRRPKATKRVASPNKKINREVCNGN